MTFKDVTSEKVCKYAHTRVCTHRRSVPVRSVTFCITVIMGQCDLLGVVRAGRDNWRKRQRE